MSYIRNFSPTQFNCFEYLPSVGNLGDTIILWKGSRFSGQKFFNNSFALCVEFKSLFSGATWSLVNIYAPCTQDGRQDFLHWFHDFDLDEDSDWLFVGDFNLIRKPVDRNKPGGNVQNMLDFNVVLNNLGLEEIPLSGNKFTWANGQINPLLERLDWFLASITWVTNYPGSAPRTLSRETSDHFLCVISVSTNIPQTKIFCFENYWLQHDDFMQVFMHGWNVPVAQEDKAKRIVAKFKNLRRVLRVWQANLSNLATVISNNKVVLMFMDTMEGFRDLTLEEWNFRNLV
jgi:hypothetical protein